MPEKEVWIGYLSGAPWRLLEMVILKCSQVYKNIFASILHFLKHPMKVLFIRIDKGQLGIWKFTVLKVLNLDSTVFPSFLKQHSPTTGGKLRLHK